MRGSLGIWAECPDGDASRPILDLHVNVWRDLPGDLSAIDFGLALREVEELRRFFLYIPAKILLEEIEDLSEVMKFGHTLGAVFNDTVEIVSHNEGSFDISRSDKSCYRIFNLAAGVDYGVEYVPIGLEYGTVITFSEALCSRLKSSQCEPYLRFRIRLSGQNREIFSSDVAPADGWLLSRFYKTELNEFRLNERRSFPNVVINWSDGNAFRIRRILYFLIRDFRHELLVQHVQFKRTRRLEPVIWREYLAGPHNYDRLADEDLGNRMLIYQWREDMRKIDPGSAGVASVKWVEDFAAFASFKSPKDNIKTYVFAIVALGAIGGSIQSVIFAIVKVISKSLKMANVPDLLSSDLFVASVGTVLLISLLVAGVVGASALEKRRSK